MAVRAAAMVEDTMEAMVADMVVAVVDMVGATVADMAAAVAMEEVANMVAAEDMATKEVAGAAPMPKKLKPLRKIKPKQKPRTRVSTSYKENNMPCNNVLC